MTTPTAQGEDRPQGLPILDIVALVIMLVVNVLASVAPLNGVSTGEISDRYPSLFTPAGYAFSIWGLIYLLLIVFVVYAVLPAQRSNRRLDRLEALFVWSCVFNVAWLFAWHAGIIWLSEILMLGLLATLIAIYRRLDIAPARHPGVERWTVDLPFSVYLGWITVATIANTAVLLISLGFDGGGLAPALTVVMIAIAVAIGLLALRSERDVAFALVLVWAFVGIAVKQSGQTQSVAVAAIVAAALLVIASLWLSRPRRTVPS